MKGTLKNRVQRQDGEYRKNFEDLNNMVTRYWKKKYGKEAANNKIEKLKQGYSRPRKAEEVGKELSVPAPQSKTQGSPIKSSYV